MLYNNPDILIIIEQLKISLKIIYEMWDVVFYWNIEQWNRRFTESNNLAIFGKIIIEVLELI